MPSAGLSSSSDPAAEAGYLLSVLRAASSGNDVSHMGPELLQAILSRPAANTHVRKLAYEVCRHTTLTESEYRKLWDSIAADANNSDPEVVATALRFLTCLPASQLADRLIIGQLAELLKPCLAAASASVRAAAVQALSHILLLPEVQQAAASSAGLANAYEGLWDELTDSLLDERPFVVGQAAAATAQLLACGIAGGATAFSGACDAAGGSGVAAAATAGAAGGGAAGGDAGGSLVAFMMSRFADRAAQRLAAALGPVLEMCGLVPAPGQVAVCDMLTALTRRALTHALRAAAGVPPPPPPPGVPAPGLSSLVSSVASYLSTLLQTGDAAARTEACGAVLELAADLAAAGPAAGGAAAALPQALVLAAADSLMQLREREFVEAGLGDICEALAEALPALRSPARADVLRKLWPLTARIDNVSRRARVFSVAWRAAVSAEMDYRTGSGAQPARTPLTGPALASPSPFPALAAAPAPSSTAGSDPLGLLAGLAAPQSAGASAAAGSDPAAAGVVTAVPPSCRVAALLGEPYVGAIMAGRAPAAEAGGAFTAAQASAATVASPTSSSLLTTVASMTRAAPPPPPPPPLSLPRVESSGRTSGSGTPVDSGRGGKAEKDKKSGFGARFFRSKTKARPGEPDGADHAAAAAAQEAAAAAKGQEAASAAAASVASAASAASAGLASPQGSAVPSPLRLSSPPTTLASPTRGGNEPMGPLSGGSNADAAAAALVRPPPSHATLRHELLQCLLQQLAHHPAAALASELCAEHAAAARHDRHPATSSLSSASASSSSSSPLACRLGQVVQWVAMASEVLADSAGCVAWEPYVMPAITSNPGTAAAAAVPLDFNNLTADLWLGLLQAALQASRSAAARLGRMVAEAVEAAGAASANANAGGLGGGAVGMGYGMPYGMAAGGMAAAQQQQQAAAEVTGEAHCRALLALLKARTDALQGLLMKLLSGYSGLSASVRPRVVWVASACLPLPGHWDERWELLLGCLDGLLVRGTDVLGASRRHDLMGSALAGGLFVAGRQAWIDPTRPFLFDIASASALCEAAEYEAAGLLVGLSSLQQLAARLLNAVADAVPHGSAGAAHGQAAAVATRLEAVMRLFIGTELAASPHVRDWCKRIMRYLATLMTYTPPLNLPPTVAALGLIAKQAHEADGTAADAADDDSSDASSAYAPEDGQRELPPALAAAAAAVAAAAAAAVATPAQAQPQDAAAAAAAGTTAGTAVNGAAPSGDAAAAAGEDASKQKPGNSYLVHSAAASVPMWGYPFAPLSAVSLHTSKRARRHRALSAHLAAAAAAAEAPRPVLTAAAPPADSPSSSLPALSSGPALSSSRTQYRLDSEAFWSALPASHSPWQELTGPADPLLLRGCYVRPDPARGAAATITVLLSAVNRLPVDVSDVEVSLKTSGPLLSSIRRAATWELPRLAAHDRAAAAFSFKVLGYGDLQLHARLQLCPAPPRIDASPLQLVCVPLEVPHWVLLRPPRRQPEAAEFFRSWGTLPARTELSGVCTWPGPEGGALLLSALLRAPLGCAWLQHVPAVAGFQAAFAADTAPGDSLALVVVTQLMPPPAPGGPAETFCSLSIRSSSSDLILCLQSGAAAWLAQITSGTASLGGAGRTSAQPPAPSAKPPLHPRVAALLQSFSASAAQLATATSGGGSGAPLMPMSSFGLTAAGATGAANAAAAGAGAGGAGASVGGVGGGGSGSNSVMMKNAALLEWQRLASLAAV